MAHPPQDEGGIVHSGSAQGKDCRRKDVSYVTEPVICRRSASRKQIAHDSI